MPIKANMENIKLRDCIIYCKCTNHEYRVVLINKKETGKT